MHIMAVDTHTTVPNRREQNVGTLSSAPVLCSPRTSPSRPPASRGPDPVKLVHTRNESRVTEQVTAADSASAAANLFELSVLSEVCEVERAKLCPAPEQETAGVSVATVPPDPAPSFNPLPKRPVLN